MQFSYDPMALGLSFMEGRWVMAKGVCLWKVRGRKASVMAREAAKKGLMGTGRVRNLLGREGRGWGFWLSTLHHWLFALCHWFSALHHQLSALLHWFSMLHHWLSVLHHDYLRYIIGYLCYAIDYPHGSSAAFNHFQQLISQVVDKLTALFTFSPSLLRPICSDPRAKRKGIWIIFLPKWHGFNCAFWERETFSSWFLQAQNWPWGVRAHLWRAELHFHIFQVGSGEP